MLLFLLLTLSMYFFCRDNIILCFKNFLRKYPMYQMPILKSIITWKLSKYGVISGPYFPLFAQCILSTIPSEILPKQKKLLTILLHFGEVYFSTGRSSSPQVFFFKKAVLKSSANFTWKHLCWKLSTNKISNYRPFSEYLWVTASVLLPSVILFENQ